MKILLRSLVLGGFPLLAFAQAQADGGLPLPEPESLALLAVGAVGLIVALRRKRK